MTNQLQKKYEILASSKCGIEFEFYTELKGKDLTRDLSRSLGKKVIFPVAITGLNQEEKGGYHSDMEPTATTYKLERDYSGGGDMYEMVTGPMAYEEARIIIIKMLQWIKEKGWTDSKAAIHLNVSFNEFKTTLRKPLMELNVLKFILGFDESFIYERFPNRRDSVYAKSINNIYPINRFVFFDNPDRIDRYEYVTPNEKYYGVNFTKLPKNYLEFRYLGGIGYENKTFKILEILDYIVLKLYSTLAQNQVYTPNEKDKLHKILKPQKKAVQSFSDPEQFLLSYPNLRVTVDMKGDIEILKSYWTTIRDKLFSLIVDSGLKEGHFNLDTDYSAFQLRGGVMKKANHIENMELFDCEISGTIQDSDLYRCKINSSRISDSKLIESNTVDNSKVEKTSIMPGNFLDNCYISNPQELIDGSVKGGVIRKGIIGENAKISKTTIIVDAVGSAKGYDKKDDTTLSDAFTKNIGLEK